MPRLKVGTKAVTTTNGKDSEFVNESISIVKSFNPKFVDVSFNNKLELTFCKKEELIL